MPRAGRLRAASVLVVVVMAVLTAARASAQGQARALAVGPLDPGDASVVEFARQGAIARLRGPECQKLLLDFTDAGGRTLLENLAAFGVPPDAYIAMLPLLDGSARPLCKANQSQLLTTAGVPRVFVCRSFVKAVYQQRTMAEVHLIHEMLHTLGLGENPPTSQEITQKVVRRCAP